MASLADLFRALQQFESSASEASAALLSQFHELQAAFKKHKQHVFDLLSAPSARVAAHAQCGFGRTAPRFRELQESPWRLTADALIDAFGPAAVFSEDFTKLICELAAKCPQWDAAHRLLLDARNRRRAGISASTGISRKRDWTPQDAKEAMASVGVDRAAKRPAKRPVEAQQDQPQRPPPPKRRRRRRRRLTTIPEEPSSPSLSPSDAPTDAGTADGGGGEEAVDAHTSGRLDLPGSSVSHDEEEHSHDDGPAKSSHAGEDDAGSDSDGSAASLERARHAVDELDDASFHLSPPPAFLSDDDWEDSGGVCGGGIGSDGEAVGAADPEVPPAATEASPPDPTGPQSWPCTPRKSPAARAEVRPTRLPSAYTSNGLQNPPMSISQLLNPMANALCPGQPKPDDPSSGMPHQAHVLANGIEPRQPESMAVAAGPASSPSSCTSRTHANPAALQQLREDTRLGDEAMETILGPFHTAEVAVFAVASPAMGDWQAWARTHWLKLLPGQATALVPLYQPAMRHWALLHFHLPSASVTLYNSMPTRNGGADVRTIGSALVSALGMDADNRAWTFTALSPVPVQDGAGDGGVCILVFALYALASRTLPGDIDPRLWRRLFRDALAGGQAEGFSLLPALASNTQPSTIAAFLERHRALQDAARAMSKLRDHAHEMAALIAVLDTQAEARSRKAQAVEDVAEQGVRARKKALELLQAVDQLQADDAAILTSVKKRIDECEREASRARARMEQASGCSTLVHRLQQSVQRLCADVDARAREVENELGIMDLVMEQADQKLVEWMAAFRQSALGEGSKE
ncbi:hypothetical protein B0J12DRAFT_745863 [Macrophomina phaseolina]|uniref:Uncharacterized protein n=1 Tax=Macrophomina phaseolina TaxID=35725 RepID=A0ABQ8FX02_9PEZI|nr:hypothetical protein B0J12DRAFT_745863 [Macrophomina phaseolina]